MEIKKINVNKALTIFLFSHLIIWTLVPSISNDNLPLDVIEAIAWGDGWPLGWQKHPPLSSWFPELFFQIFGSQDWAFYFLSQLFVVLSFFLIWKFSRDFLKNKIHSLISILLLEGIYFYNFTTPEFNVNVCQLPFWVLTVYYCWKGIKHSDTTSWLLFGFFSALGVLSKYLFIYLLLSIIIFFIYTLIKDKKFNFKCLFSLLSFSVVILPHIAWLIDNNYPPIQWALQRSGLDEYNFFDHLYYPLIFLFKQIIILIPFFAMLLLLISNFKIKINFNDKKLIFLISITIIPIFLIFFTSLISGAKIRTMWMVPFYLFIGVFFLYLFQNKIYTQKIKIFFSLFLFLFFISPTIYYLVSSTQTNKRTDYPGKKISQIIHSQWKKNYSNKIEIVVGNEWYAGNFIYHSDLRPKWKNNINKNIDRGILLISGFNELKNCPGLLYQIGPFNDICMIGGK